MQISQMRNVVLAVLLSSSLGAQAAGVCNWDAFGKGVLGLAALKKALRDYRKDYFTPARAAGLDNAACDAAACTSCPTTNRMLNMSSNLLDMAAITVLAVTACQHLRNACVNSVVAA
ncbi:MAG TPA: hypothetical protein VJJ83_04020 [Candidatus Babeliales bacterium]|nr:hypothetical protein [Candidatus Babeliales bacterium]